MDSFAFEFTVVHIFRISFYQCGNLSPIKLSKCHPLHWLTDDGTCSPGCINALLIQPSRTTPVSIVLRSDRSGAYVEDLTGERRCPKVSCQHLWGKGPIPAAAAIEPKCNTNSNSAEKAQEKRHNVLHTLRVFKCMHVVQLQPVVWVCVCVCCTSLWCDFSQSCSYNKWRGSTSTTSLLHAGVNRRYACVCGCYLRSLPCRTPWLHTSPAGTLLSLTVYIL